jgi:hypothetical protein
MARRAGREPVGVGVVVVTPRWGKAGERLTEAEARKQAGRRRLEAVRIEQSIAREEELGYQDWAAGLLSPDRITLALDAKGLEGPEVDAQCLAQEPEVDQWEAGTLYPSWEQTKALAELCGVTPRFLMNRFNDPLGTGVDVRAIRSAKTTLRFHAKLPDEPPPIERFTEDAICDRMNPDAARVVPIYRETLW